MSTIAGVAPKSFVALTLGLSALLAGVLALVSMSDHEHDEARAQIPRERARLERMAQETLRADLRALHAQLDDDITLALAAPFAPDTTLVFQRGAQSILPRTTRPTTSAASTPLTTDERARIDLARHAADSDAAYQAWLEHRVHYQLSATSDLSSTLIALDALAQHDRLTPALATALLRDGLTLPDGRVDAFFTTLLYGASPLATDADDELWRRASALAKRFTVRVDDVAARRLDPAAPLARPPQVAPEGQSITCHNATCLVLDRTGDTLRGHHLDLASWQASLTRAWRADGTLPSDATIAIATRAPDALITIDAPSWHAASALADKRFVLKVSALAAVGALAVAVFVMAILLQRRRAAYIALRSHLISAVTHELKTPLASISALAQTLELRYGDEPRARDYATRIVDAADRLGDLVDNILSFTRLERGAWKLRPAPIPVADLAAWLASEIVPRAPRPIDLTTDIDDTVLIADRDLVQLLLSNLVDNAAKYATADRVRVTFSAHSSATTTRLVIADDGPGLSPTAHANPRGTGLGLAICRSVARLHQATFDIATATTGTTITTDFPIKQRQHDH